MERYVSAMTSSRASAPLFHGGGPLTINEAAFICGRPDILERPLMVKVSASRFVEKLAARFPSSEKSRNTSSEMMAISRAAQMEFSFDISAGFVKCPVGLLG